MATKNTAKAEAPAKAETPKSTKPTKAKAAEVVEEQSSVSEDDAAEEASGGVTYGRKELADAIRSHLHEKGIAVTPKIALESVLAFEEVVKAVIAEGSDLALPGFGKFKVSTRAGGTRRNPSTGEEFTVEASYAVSFKVGKALKEAAASLGVPATVEAAE